MRAVVGVPFTVAVPEAPCAKGGMRPDDVDSLDARDAGRSGDEAIFLGRDEGCEGGEGNAACNRGAAGEDVGNGVWDVETPFGGDGGRTAGLREGDTEGGTKGVASGDGVRLATGEWGIVSNGPVAEPVSVTGACASSLDSEEGPAIGMELLLDREGKRCELGPRASGKISSS